MAEPRADPSPQDQLAVACSKGDLSAVKAVIAAGGSVNAVGECLYGTKAPLEAAVSCKHVDVVKYLLAQGADVNGDEVLFSGVGNSTPEILQLLIDAGGDVNRVAGMHSLPIFVAAMAVGDVVGKLRVLLAQPDLILTSASGTGKKADEHALAQRKPALAVMIREEVRWGCVAVF